MHNAEREVTSLEPYYVTTKDIYDQVIFREAIYKLNTQARRYEFVGMVEESRY
jgi:hypothetical protein